MMARIGLLRSRRRNAHSVQPEVNCRLGTDDRAILEVDKFDLRTRRRRSRTPSDRGLGKGGRAVSKACDQHEHWPRVQLHADLPTIFEPAWTLDRLLARLSEDVDVHASLWDLLLSGPGRL